jgi:predicted NUDIX family NTP pyrophosphohydrolase
VPKLSAGLLLYRTGAAGVEVLIAHPGGPFWARKDEGAWSIPKGEYAIGDDPWESAVREFTEELGLAPPDGSRIELGEVKQSGGKVVTVFAVGADLDVTDSRSNTFEMEWPPKSGRLQAFPEVDRVAWVSVDTARVKLLKGQAPILDRLLIQVGPAS